MDFYTVFLLIWAMGATYCAGMFWSALENMRRRNRDLGNIRIRIISQDNFLCLDESFKGMGARVKMSGGAYTYEVGRGRCELVEGGAQ